EQLLRFVSLALVYNTNSSPTSQQKKNILFHFSFDCFLNVFLCLLYMAGNGHLMIPMVLHFDNKKGHWLKVNILCITIVQLLFLFIIQ
ncbi:MAG: hypothetical protein ACRCZJ_08445, partial [Erysipelotrichaceae bacterium]